MRWLIAMVLSVAVVGPASAGVFKSRGSKPAAPAAKKQPAAPVAKRAPAKAAKKAEPTEAAEKPEKAVAQRTTKKGRNPIDDAIDDAPAPKKAGKAGKAAKGGGGVTIIEEPAEDDVIIRDIDD